MPGGIDGIDRHRPHGPHQCDLCGIADECLDRRMVGDNRIGAGHANERAGRPRGIGARRVAAWRQIGLCGDRHRAGGYDIGGPHARGQALRERDVGERCADGEPPCRHAERIGLDIEGGCGGNHHRTRYRGAHAAPQRRRNVRRYRHETEIRCPGIHPHRERVGVDPGRHHRLRTDKECSDRGGEAADDSVGINRRGCAAADCHLSKCRPGAHVSDIGLCHQRIDTAVGRGGKVHAPGRTDTAQRRLGHACVVHHNHTGANADEPHLHCHAGVGLIRGQHGIDRDRSTRRVRAVIGRCHIIGDRYDINRGSCADHTARHLAEQFADVQLLAGGHSDIRARDDCRSRVDQRRCSRWRWHIGFTRLQACRPGCRCGNRGSRRTRGCIDPVGAAVGIAAVAGQAAEARSARHHPRCRLGLIGGTAVRAAPIVLRRVGAVAVIVGIAARQLRPDRPHVDRGPHADRSARAADHNPGEILLTDRIDRDIARCSDAGAAPDFRCGVVVQRADIDGAGRADEPTRDTHDVALHRHLV